jgi:diketogulonate reductase-like aldo/keto reductase
MHLKLIPSTKEQLPVIGLGSWSTFDFANDAFKLEKAKAVITNFTNGGGKLIDTSPMYGHAESVIGDIYSELKPGSNVFMATKVWTTGKQKGIEQINESFEKLKVKIIDLIQVHNLVDVKIHLDTLRKWKDEGKVRYIGITHYTNSAYSKLIELIKTESLDFIQFNYNVQTREAEKILLPTAHEYGVAVIINRPFEEGKLFEIVSGKQLPPWASDFNINSWAQYFLKYIISHKAVTCVIPATQDVEHLDDFMQAGEGVLPDETIRKKMIDYYLTTL